jgi:DNA-binding transcriptional MerR regulator
VYATPVEGESAYYSVDEAAEVLQESPARVREMLATGELEGLPPGATTGGEWRVLLRLAPARAQAPHTDEPADRPPEQPEEFTDVEDATVESEDLSRGDNEATHREPSASSGWVTTQQAARALDISPRTVRWHIEQGNLDAKPEGKGVKRTWLISIDSLQAYRDARQATPAPPRAYRAEAKGADIAAEDLGNPIRELADRLAEEAARAAEYRIRLELTEQAQSTLEERLAEVRQRRDELEQERDELRRELEALREARESPTAATEQPGRVEPQTPLEGAPEPRESSEMHMPEVGGGPLPRDQQRPSERPWWRRMFGA